MAKRNPLIAVIALLAALSLLVAACGDDDVGEPVADAVGEAG